MNMELAVLGQEISEVNQTTIANNNEIPETSETQNETEYTVYPQLKYQSKQKQKKYQTEILSQVQILIMEQQQ